jgi:hypothetical protein
MPFPWDEDDPEVRNRIMDNMALLLPEVVTSGRRRDPPTVDLIQDWHRRMLDGVPVAEPAVAGGFRGSGPQGGRLRTYRVVVDRVEAVRPGRVRSEMSLFGRHMEEQVAALDPLIPAKAPPGRREYEVITLCAWAHGELIRIHPFADGNGRMARAVILWIEPATACPCSSTFAHGRLVQPATKVHREPPWTAVTSSWRSLLSTCSPGTAPRAMAERLRAAPGGP